MSTPEQNNLAMQLEHLSRICANRLATAALDLARAALAQEVADQRASLAYLLEVAIEQLALEDNQVARVALASSAGALQHDGLLVAAATRLLIQYGAVSSADLLETVGLRLELEAATRQNAQIERVAHLVQSACIHYAGADDVA